MNSNFRLQQGQCVYFKSCAKQQYLNSGGQCVDVSPNCATWNPSNGQCITCKIIGTQPIQGICCPLGQVYSSGKCVNQVALQNSYQSATGPACLIRHPSLNICVKCAQGYSPDYTVPYACAKENWSFIPKNYLLLLLLKMKIVDKAFLFQNLIFDISFSLNIYYLIMIDCDGWMLLIIWSNYFID